MGAISFFSPRAAEGAFCARTALCVRSGARKGVLCFASWKSKHPSPSDVIYHAPNDRRVCVFNVFGVNSATGLELVWPKRKVFAKLRSRRSALEMLCGAKAYRGVSSNWPIATIRVSFVCKTIFKDTSFLNAPIFSHFTGWRLFFLFLCGGSNFPACRDMPAK